jgi:hypothetical protein
MIGRTKIVVLRPERQYRGIAPTLDFNRFSNNNLPILQLIELVRAGRVQTPLIGRTIGCRLMARTTISRHGNKD